MSKKLKKRNLYQDHCILSPQTSENFTLSEKNGNSMFWWARDENMSSTAEECFLFQTL